MALQNFDSFDAMNLNRIYRNRLTKEHIFEKIETDKGKQFDPKIADVWLRIMKKEFSEYRVVCQKYPLFVKECLHLSQLLSII